MDIAVAIIFFNRPEKLKEVFEKVKIVKPKKLFLIQDGPRKNNEKDIKNIKSCRKIVENVNWKCDVYKNYSNENLGVGIRPYSGITWVFEHVEDAIILEDDCVPDISFFEFCAKMLKKYKDNERIMLISGMNLLETYDNGFSYTFSQACTIGAWATWKRVWEKYDFNIEKFDDAKVKRELNNKLKLKDVRDMKFWAWNLTREKIKHNEILPWWDYQLSFLLYLDDGLGIVPNKNLIKNIGYGEGATNVSKKEDGRHFNINSYSISKNLKHPDVIKNDDDFDKKLYELQNIKINKIKIFFSKIKRTIIRFIRRLK